MKILLTMIAFLMSVNTFADKTHSDHKHKMEKSINVEIGKKGFKAEKPLKFKLGENIVLNITRTTKKTCMTALKHSKTGKLIELPMNKLVKFEIGSYDSAKEVKLLCGMGMKAGVVFIK